MENVITLSLIDQFSKFKKILSFFINCKVSVQNLLHILEILNLEKLSPETCAAHRKLGVKMKNVVTLSSVDQFPKFKHFSSYQFQGVYAGFAVYS